MRSVKGNIMKIKSIFTSCCLSLFVLGIATQAMAAEACLDAPINLRLASPSPTGSNMVRGYEKLAELISAKSQCKINIQVVADAKLGGDREILEAVQLGAIDMGSSSSPNMASFSSEYMVFDLPFVTSPKYQRKLYAALDNGELGKYFEEIANKSGMTIIMWSEYGYRNFVSTNKPLNSIADLAGLKVRTTDSPIEVAVAMALGMVPLPISWPETYPALKQGLIDAEGNNWEHLVTANHIDALKYAIDSQHNYSMHILFMNKDTYDKLPQEAKVILREAAAEALTWQRLISRDIDEVSKEAMLQVGIKFHDISDQEREKLKAKTKVVWDEFGEQLNPKALQLLLDTQK